MVVSSHFLLLSLSSQGIFCGVCLQQKLISTVHETKKASRESAALQCISNAPYYHAAGLSINLSLGSGSQGCKCLQWALFPGPVTPPHTLQLRFRSCDYGHLVGLELGGACREEQICDESRHADVLSLSCPHSVLRVWLLGLPVSCGPSRSNIQTRSSRPGVAFLAARLIKGRLCSVGGAFGAEEEPEAASVAAVVGSSKVGQTERCREIYI